MNLRPLVFGEVLFDVFDDGGEVLGGAPLNVAWHLQGFGRHPLLLSALGRDARGDAIVETLRTHGLDRAGLQVVSEHPTGVVRATVDGADVNYDIVEDVAYDHVDADAALAAIRAHDASCLIHGTLALRAPESARAFRAVRATIDAPVFCDVNLRPPHTPLERVQDLLEGAAWVKVNGDELAQLTGLSVEMPSDAGRAGAALRDRHDLRAVLVTMGADGACLVPSRGDAHYVPAPVLDDVVDPIGAGDAFASVAVIGLLEDWAPTTLLRRAHDFAATVCRIRGATPDDPAVYARVLAAWKEESDA